MLFRYTIPLAIFLILLGLINFRAQADMSNKEIVDALTDWAPWNDWGAEKALSEAGSYRQGYLLIEITARRNSNYRGLIKNFLSVVDILNEVIEAFTAPTIVDWFLSFKLLSWVLDSYNIQAYLFAKLEQSLDEFFDTMNYVCANEGFKDRLASEMTRLLGGADFERINEICSTYLTDQRAIQEGIKEAKSNLNKYPPPSTDFTLYLHAGWNMVSSVGGDTDISTLAGSCNVVGGPWWYDPQAKKYVKFNTLKPDKGYWVKVSNSCVMYFSPGPLTSAPVTWGPGWRMVSPVAYNKNANELFTSCQIAAGPYWWNGNSYEKPSILEPTKGYWIKVGDACFTTLSFRGLQEEPPPPPPDTPSPPPQPPPPSPPGTPLPPTPGPGNQLPIAAFTYAPQNPKPGEVITFDCSPSRDPDGSIVSCRWDFGGQGTHVSEQGKQHQHKFDREGTYTVTLTVKDNTGAESSTSQTISVRSGTTPGPGPTPPPPSTGMLECLAGSDQFIEDLEMLSIIDAWIKNKSYKTCGAPTDSNVLQALNLWIKATVRVTLHLITDRVSDDNAPGATRKQFSPEERTVYSFVKLEGRIGGQKVSWEFIDPQGKVYWSAEALLPADKNIGVAWIQVAGSKAAQLPGRWKVKFYIDGRLQFEDTFEIIKSGSKPAASKAEVGSRRPLGAWRFGVSR